MIIEAHSPAATPTCSHGSDFLAEVVISPNGLTADIRALCAACGAPVIWHCPDVGLLPDGPTISIDGQELRIPLRMATDPGLQFPRFIIRHRPEANPN